MRQFLRRSLTGLAACYLVSAWAGCKSASPYDQLEMEKRKYEQMQEEKDQKGWMRTSVAIPLSSTRETEVVPLDFDPQPQTSIALEPLAK